MVLIHGVGCHGDDWRYVLPELTKRFNVITYDQRGHRHTPAPDGRWRIEDLASDLSDLLDSLGIERAHVAGFSLGGIVAQRFAIAYPQRVNRLGLISTTTGRTAAEIDAAHDRLRIIENQPPAEYFAQSIDRWYTPEFQTSHPHVIEENGSTIINMDRSAYSRAYQVLIETNLYDELDKITAPTLVVTGEHDVGSPPSMTHKLAERIPDARGIILPRLRHNILMEAPGILGGLLREFFTS